MYLLALFLYYSYTYYGITCSYSCLQIIVFDFFEPITNISGLALKLYRAIIHCALSGFTTLSLVSTGVFSLFP